MSEPASLQSANCAQLVAQYLGPVAFSSTNPRLRLFLRKSLRPSTGLSLWVSLDALALPQRNLRPNGKSSSLRSPYPVLFLSYLAIFKVSLINVQHCALVSGTFIIF